MSVLGKSGHQPALSSRMRDQPAWLSAGEVHQRKTMCEKLSRFWKELVPTSARSFGVKSPAARQRQAVPSDFGIGIARSL